MAIVIEVLNRHKRVAQRYLFEKSSVTIGRGYENDVILDDFHVDPEHAVLNVDESAEYTLTDLNSLNGIRDKRKKRLDGPIVFSSIHDFFFGETRVRITDTSYPLLDTLNLRHDKLFSRMANSLLLACFALVLVNLHVVYQTFIASTQTVEVVKYVQACAWFTFAVISITLLVSFIGKVFRREWNFAFNLFVFCLFILAADAGDFILDVFAFNFYLVKVKWVIDAVWIALMVTAVVWAVTKTTFYIKPFAHRVVLGTAGIMTFGLLSIQHMYDQTPKFVNQPPMTQIFRQQGYRWVEPISDASFIQESGMVFDIPLEDVTD